MWFLRNPTYGSSHYFVNFIDDFFIHCYSYLLKANDEFFNKFIVFKAQTGNKTKKEIKILRSDRRGEYTSNELAMFYIEYGTIHEVIASHSFQSNGVAE